MARKKQHGIRSTAVVKWNCNSKDGKKLKKLLEGGVITASMSPKVIREMFPQFQKYGDQSFRSALSRMKTLTGFNTRGFGANNDDDMSVLGKKAEIICEMSPSYVSETLSFFSQMLTTFLMMTMMKKKILRCVV